MIRLACVDHGHAPPQAEMPNCQDQLDLSVFRLSRNCPDPSILFTAPAIAT